MDERTKLTGIARFSPRLNLLAKLAESDNPILSISAAFLLRDRTARRMGASFELMFLMILPVIDVAMTGIMHMAAQPGGQYSAFSPATVLAMIASSVLTMMAGIYGIIVLVLPGNAIMKRERDGLLLRFIPVEPNEVFRNMLKLQLNSFLLVPSIYFVFDAVLKTGMWLAFPNAFGSLPSPYASPLTTVLGFVTSIALFVYITIFSIISSFRYQAAWAAFMELIGALVVYYIISYVGTAIFMFKYIYAQSPQNISDDWYIKSIIDSCFYQIAVFSLLFLASIVLARKVVYDRIRPMR